MNIAVEISTSYWTIANVITAFGVLQIYGFLYALAEKESLLAYVRKGWWGAIFVLFVGTFLYGYLIHNCYSAEKGLLETRPGLLPVLAASKLAYVSRQLVILAMFGLVLFTLIADRKIHRDKYL